MRRYGRDTDACDTHFRQSGRNSPASIYTPHQFAGTPMICFQKNTAVINSELSVAPPSFPWIMFAISSAPVQPRIAPWHEFAAPRRYCHTETRNSGANMCPGLHPRSSYRSTCFWFLDVFFLRAARGSETKKTVGLAERVTKETKPSAMRSSPPVQEQLRPTVSAKCTAECALAYWNQSLLTASP